MTQTLAEPSVSIAEEPPSIEGPEPLLTPETIAPSAEAQAAEVAVVAACRGDCKRCVVQAIVNRMEKKGPLRRNEAVELQHRFDDQAFGINRPADRYVRPIPEQEESLVQMKARVEGCDKIANGSRLLTVAMLEHSEYTLQMKIDAERALYISSMTFGASAKPVEEKPFVPPTPYTPIQRLAKSFGLGSFVS